MYFVYGIMWRSRDSDESILLEGEGVLGFELEDSKLLEAVFIGDFCLRWLGLTAVNLRLEAVSLRLTDVQICGGFDARCLLFSEYVKPLFFKGVKKYSKVLV